MKDITLFIPGSTDVILKGFTNAAYLQRISLTTSSSTKIFTGSGEGNAPMFTFPLTTPPGDYTELNINFDYSTDGGNTWNAVDIYSDSCYIQNYQVNVIVSEDMADADYNDCVCFVSYPGTIQNSHDTSGDSRLKNADSSSMNAATTIDTQLNDSVTVLLPYSKTVVIQAFANAANIQQITIQPQGGKPLIWTGSGYYDTLLGSMMLATPSGSGEGFPVIVTIESSNDGGNTWQASQVDQGLCQPVYYAARIVASEDGNDSSWDDATVYFTWMALPNSLRSK